MHIAHILRCMAERMGGPPRSVWGLGQSLVKNSVDVSYWSAANKEDMSELAASRPVVNACQMAWPHAWFRSTELTQQLTRNIKSIDVMHIHGLWSHPHYSGTKICRCRNKPYIIAPRGELEPWRVRHTLFKYIKKRIFLSLIGNRMLKGASCLHAITPIEIEGFRWAGYRGPITMIPNGVDANAYEQLSNPLEAEHKWPILKNRRVVLFLSRLSPEKGLDQFLSTWADITSLSRYDDVILIIAGPDDRGYRAVLKELVEKHQLQSHVVFTGMVGEQEKKSLLSRADIYTLPSYSEGFSMSILEALASSTPVLITPGCNFPQVAEVKAGLCVEPEAGVMAEAMRQLLDMPESRLKEMGKRGRSLILKDYTWDVIARKMMTVYNCILEGKDVPLYP